MKSFDGVNIWYEYKKQSELCLVFIHGWGNDWTSWEDEIKYFFEKGYSVLYLDLRGHGQSEKPEEREAYHIENFAKDLHFILEHEGVRDFVLVGHSMGGMISLTYEKLYPKTAKGFVLCSTTAQSVATYRREKVLVPFVKHMLQYILEHEHIHAEHFEKLKDVDFTKFADLPDIEIFMKGLKIVPMKAILACFDEMLQYSAEDILKSIEVPVLIIEGEQDKLLPSVHSTHMFEEIENAEIEFVPHGRHFVTLEEPALVSKYMFSFLSKHSLQ